MKVDHVGIAVQDLEASIEKFKSIFPDIEAKYEEVKDGSMRTAFLLFENTKVELMQPLEEDSAVGKFIAKRGQGIHHISVETEDIFDSIARAKASGIRVINEEPREGSGGHLVSFAHPKDFNGVLLEFCQSIINGN